MAKHKMVNVVKVCNELINELERAEKNWPEFPSHNPVESVSIMAEEAGECTRAANRMKWENKPYSELREELIQTGAMVLRCVKNLDKEHGIVQGAGDNR